MRLRLLLAALATLASLASAAEDGGVPPVTGRVVYRGKPVPGAVVTVRQDQKQWTTVTDESGAFIIREADSGPADVEVRMFGFEPLVKRNVQGSERSRLELVLSMPALRNGAAASQGAVETLEAQISQALQPAAVSGM
ncbi:MAG: carboxypeptidase-like regulatory domain-containing protein, partial [Bryobacteraceae bacterium]